MTDAQVVAGILRPERFLGGRMTLRPDLAAKAIESIGLDMPPTQAADSVLRMVNNNMAAALRLVNPISADLDGMRPSVIPNLVDAIRRNRARGMADISLFELGPQYGDDTPEGQALVAAGARAGSAAPRHWAAPSRPVDAFDAKADALAALAAAAAPTASLQVRGDAPAWYHPSRSGTLALGRTFEREPSTDPKGHKPSGRTESGRGGQPRW